MKVQNINQNTNFKGYKNIICYGFQTSDSKLNYMGMQLDNEGTPDLDNWRALKKRLAPQTNLPDDIVHFNVSAIPHIEPVVSLNGIVLADSELLNEDGLSQRDKKTNFQAYNLIASLTKRIANDSLFDWNKEITKVGTELYKEFRKIFDNQDNKAVYLLTQGTRKLVKEQVIAGKINKDIHKIMKQALK